MRDIKFRVWNGKNMITENVVFLGKSKFAIELDGMDWAFDFGRFGDPVFIGMQFTGLKDKNGVEIYEGDVVYCATRDSTGIPEQEAQFVVEFDYGSFLAMTASDEQEVIGNIHQNPELLNA